MTIRQPKKYPTRACHYVLPIPVHHPGCCPSTSLQIGYPSLLSALAELHGVKCNTISPKRGLLPRLGSFAQDSLTVFTRGSILGPIKTSASSWYVRCAFCTPLVTTLNTSSLGPAFTPARPPIPAAAPPRYGSRNPREARVPDQREGSRTIYPRPPGPSLANSAHRGDPPVPKPPVPPAHASRTLGN